MWNLEGAKLDCLILTLKEDEKEQTEEEFFFSCGC